MKKQILILAVLILSGVAAVAQQRPDNRRFDNRGDYCEAVCHRFSEACRLSDDDAATFKGRYETYYSKLQSIREQYRPQCRSGMSDDEVESHFACIWLLFHSFEILISTCKVRLSLC